MTALGRLEALRRHPVKGFTPERLDAVELAAGAPFPCDRLYAVENGPSGFDPDAPAHLSKMRFVMLAQIGAIARVHTRFDAATHGLTVEALGRDGFNGRLDDPDGRLDFAAWLTGFLQLVDPDMIRGPLRVLSAEGHRFFDSRSGHVSVVNLASVRQLGEVVGASIDPARFRANLYVDGWPAWSELEAAEGARLRIGEAVLRVVKPTRRCAAIQVDPTTGARDLDLVETLRETYGHMNCGVYLQVEAGGVMRPGDAALWESRA